MRRVLESRVGGVRTLTPADHTSATTCGDVAPYCNTTSASKVVTFEGASSRSRADREEYALFLKHT